MPEELKELYVVTGVNEEGVEGVASYLSPNQKTLVPLVGGRARCGELMVVAQALANTSRIPLKIKKYLFVELLAEIEPEGDKLHECDRAETEDD